MIKENISALIVVVRLKLLWMGALVKREEFAPNAIRYLTAIHTKELIIVKL